MIEDILELIKLEAAAVMNIPATIEFEKALNLIHSCVHEKSGKIVTSGMGKAGQIAVNIATTFSSTGTPSVYLHPSDAQHGDLGVIQNNDVLLLISNSGKTREIVELLSLAKGLVPNIPIIVITSNTGSEIALSADALLDTGNPTEVCALGLSPTTSTTTMTVIGDIMVVLMMKKIGFTSKDYSLRHHGGYLGEKSRTDAKNNIDN